MIHHRTLTLCCIALLFLLVTCANAVLQLELVHIVHRNGVIVPNANTPNREKMCSPDGKTNCSAIANLGVQQVTAMGNYIKTLYGEDKEIKGASTWFNTYDPSRVETHSLGETEEVQAASAILRGIYSAPTMNPVVISSDPVSDRMLNADAYPSIALANEARRAAVNTQVEAVVDKQFPDSKVLVAMGAEVGADGLCSGPAKRVSCCLSLAKLGAMYAATKQAGAAPTLMRHKDKLDAVAAAYSNAVYGYSADDEAMASRGSLGHLLAARVVTNMRGKMAAADSDAYNPNAVMQYAHRVPFGTAVGKVSSDLLPAGETFLLDLLRDDGTKAFFVRQRYATAATGAPAAAAFPFRCLAASGTPTTANSASGITCPLDDFVRSVDSTKGTAAAGAACYLDQATKEKLNCQVQGAPPSQACAKYRALCPKEGCPSGYVYDANDASCAPPTGGSDPYNAGVLVAICISAMFSAFMLFILSIEVCPLVCYRLRSGLVRLRNK